MLTNKQKEYIDGIAKQTEALSREERDYLFEKILKKLAKAPRYTPIAQEYAEALDAIVSYCETVSAAASLLGMDRNSFYGYKNGRIPIGARVGSRIKNIHELINAKAPRD